MCLKRHIEEKLHIYAKNFKIVLIKGARQVGKSTLIRNCFPDYKMVVFDPVQDLYGARQDPDQFLANFSAPIILDEVQYVPELIPALKRKIDLSNAKGQYILTGSQNISVIRDISESLAGRVGILELEGMTPYEIAAKSDNNWLKTYLDSPEDFTSSNQHFNTLKNKRTLYETLWQGSLPGLVDMSPEVYAGFFQSYIQTYIERDVRLFADISDLSLFSRFIALIAAYSAQEINKSQLGRDIGLSAKQATKWLEILNYSYQWREIPAFSSNIIKRISKKPKGIFTDTGLLCYLQKISSPETLGGHPLLGAIFESYCDNNIIRLAKVMNTPPNFYHWRTAAGAEVDLILERDGKLFPLKIKSSSNITKHDARGIMSFRDSHSNLKIETGLILYTGMEAYKVNDHVLAVPWNVLVE
jgi:predicted AAA+ superfamily ATPase